MPVPTRRALFLGACLLLARAGGAQVTTTGDVLVDGDLASGSVSRFVVGDRDDGAATVPAGETLETDSLTIAAQPSVIGSVVVDGGTLTTTGETRIGVGALGELTVRNGGRYTQRGGAASVAERGVGTVTVTGPGSVADFAGEFGVLDFDVSEDGFRGSPQPTRGEIAVEDGAELRTGRSFFGGAGSAGVTVSGSGSRWVINSETTLFNTTLAVRDGGRLLAAGLPGPEAAIGLDGGSLATFGGSGSLVAVDRFTINATARVEAGADVVVGTTEIGSGPGFNPEGFTRGVVELDGAGTSWTTDEIFFATQGGDAEVRITNGATLTSHADNRIVLGPPIGGSAIVTIDGAGSRWIVRSRSSFSEFFDLFVGVEQNGGRGELRITGGAKHESGAVAIGPEGRVIIAGPGSELRPLALEIAGGELTVADGAVVRASSVWRNGRDGRVVLRGGTMVIRSQFGTFSNEGVIEGDGRIDGLNNDSGGLVRVGAGQKLSIDRLTNRGEIEVDGGELAVDSFQFGSGSIELSSAKLTVDPPFGDDDRDLTIGSAAELRFADGSSRVDGKIEVSSGGLVVVSAGAAATFADPVEVSIGVAPAVLVDEGGAVTFEDSYRGRPILGGGDVRFEGEVEALASQSPDAFDADVDFGVTASLAINFFDANGGVFASDGAIDLGGELNLRNAPSFSTPGTHEVTVVEAETLTDEFDFLPQAGSLIGTRTRFVDVRYTPASAIAVFEQIAPGDANGDGVVDTADLDAWAAAYGRFGTHLADASGDSRVDAADYTIIRAAIAAAARPVPEPAALALAAVASAACVGRRATRR